MGLIKKIDGLLRRASPGLHAKLKNLYRGYKKRTNPTLSQVELRSILISDLAIKQGDVVFVHSSMRNLYCDFDKSAILGILMEVVGREGTLAFPCWQFNIRAEDYIRDHDIVFDIRNSPSAMGKIPDTLRLRKDAFRSFHPTNSIVAIGKHARDLTQGHDTDIYPCGFSSPFYKLIDLDAKIIGLGVTVSSLTFVHTVEDTIKDEFPLKTRSTTVYPCKCLDEQGLERIVNTLVAAPAIAHRDVEGFFRLHVPGEIYRNVKFKDMDFFSLDAREIYDTLKRLALEKKSIYSF